MIQPLVWAKTFLRLPDGDALNLFFDTWAILAITVDKEDMSVWFVFQLAYHATITAKLIEKHLTAFGLLVYQSGSPIRFNLPILLCLLARYYHIEPLLTDGEGQNFLFHKLLLLITTTTLSVNYTNSVFRVHKQIVMPFLGEYFYIKLFFFVWSS